MNSDGTQDARGTHASPVPRPAGPPESAGGPGASGVPPRPTHAPGAPAYDKRPSAPSPVAEWLDTPRPEARPGIWRFGFRPPKDASRDSERLSPVTVVGLLIPLVVALVLWSLWRRGSFPYQFTVLRLFTPGDWWWGGTMASAKTTEGVEARNVYDGLFFAVLMYTMGRLGSWPDAVRHFIGRRPQPARAVYALIAALVVLSFVFPDAFPLVSWDSLPVVSPLFSLTVLISGGYGLITSALFTDSLYAVVTALVVWPFAKVGGWWPYAKELLAARRGSVAPEVVVERPRAQWPALRDAGQSEVADLLSGEVAAGRMNDVDCARVEHAFALARAGASLGTFRETVLRQGGAAWTHPSGARDLPRRSAVHDLLAGQVRIGRWVSAERAPVPYRDAGAALGADVLGTSLLAVGPSGSGKTRTLIEPVTESLALRALTGACAVVAVSSAGAPLGSDDHFDVVVRIGDPASVHDLDPYAGCDDPDEAAAILSEALVGDLATPQAATALAQLLGPYRAAHGRFPALPVLRELLESPEALASLRDALAGNEVMRRELDARIRQTGTPGDAGRALADRLALLSRPVFAEFLGGSGDTHGHGDEAGPHTTPGAHPRGDDGRTPDVYRAGSAPQYADTHTTPAPHRPFSLRALADHPLRVRIDLPARGHEEAGRILTRLVLAQFNAVVREDRRAHFACLVLDDATGTVTAESVRHIQRLRSRDAGVVLALRSVGDVPEALHGPLYGAVGCRMAYAGVTTWDGNRFAQTWGTEWVETTEVAKHTVFADQPMTRAIHALRKLVTGKAVTTDAVTVRQVERERWSASQLAHEVPPGHAVLSLTSVTGEHAPPMLVDLRRSQVAVQY
ncbi:ATP/GTP-binding protein [Streptomyces niveiscabiei]|uniref:ATP/GTP-binding protein n=1 Tax=Streptomyces niveiscabiei TaxID=164115 RepID=UPI0029A04746|nr:ATP/GTP-binding protein [Streptomyces niveiscabiei]MDX3386190.1 ATP/GTP-binding protein [Streptomyces niveiscabiei]